MNDEQKRLFDAVETLRAAAWNSFDKRRPYEWKLCFSLWAVMVGFTGVLIREKVSSHPILMSIFLGLFSCVAIYLHIKWLAGLTRANTIDKKHAIFFRDEMMKQVSLSFPEPIQDLLNERDSNMGNIRDWSSRFQVGITILLSIAAIASIWVR